MKGNQFQRNFSVKLTGIFLHVFDREYPVNLTDFLQCGCLSVIIRLLFNPPDAL